MGRKWRAHRLLAMRQPKQVHVHRFVQIIHTDDARCLDCTTTVTAKDVAFGRYFVRAERDAVAFDLFGRDG
jgi:hypothetical protein